MRTFGERSADLQAAYNDRQLMRAMRAGTKGMRESGRTFLPQEPNECDKSYDARLKRSVLANFVKDTIKKLTAKPFAKELSIDCENTHGKAFLETAKTNFDANGTTLHNFAKRVFVEAAWNGLCHIFVDKKGDTIYAKVCHADSIYNAEYLNGELVILTFIEKKSVMSADGLSVKTETYERTFRKFNGVVEFALIDKSGALVEQWTKFGLDYIPLFTYYADSDEVSGEMVCRSPFHDVADLNCLHWQKESDLSTIEHICNVPVLFGRGFSDETKITIGANSMINGPYESDLKYVEHTGTAIQATRASIQALELQMQALGIEFLSTRNPKETATGVAVSADGNNCTLSAMALDLANVISRVVRCMFDFKLISDAEIKVSIHTDFALSGAAEQLNALKAARDAGDLSQEEYLKELQRRGVLRAGFDFDSNEKALALESESKPLENVPAE